MTTYDDVASGRELVMLSRERAIRELIAHGVVLEEMAYFFAKYGQTGPYDATELLRWLGY